MTATNNHTMTDAERVNLRAVMDRIIPPLEDAPGAGTRELAGEVEHMAARVPRFRRALIGVLDALSLDARARATGGFLALSEESQDQAISEIESALQHKFATVIEMVYTAYYGDPTVQRRIGWIDRPPQPEGFELDPFDEGVLEAVRQRAPFWRRV